MLSSEDLSDLFGQNDATETLTFSGGSTVTGYFWGDYVEALGVSGNMLVFLVQTSDATGVAIDETASRGGDTLAVKHREPDLAMGWTRLIMEKQ